MGRGGSLSGVKEDIADLQLVDHHQLLNIEHGYRVLLFPGLLYIVPILSH